MLQEAGVTSWIKESVAVFRVYLVGVSLKHGASLQEQFGRFSMTCIDRRSRDLFEASHAQWRGRRYSWSTCIL